MSGIFARKALLADGWADNVRLGIEGGQIAEVAADASANGSDVELGIVIPGLANAHSHAFQRVLAGRGDRWLCRIHRCTLDRVRDPARCHFQ